MKSSNRTLPSLFCYTSKIKTMNNIPLSLALLCCCALPTPANAEIFFFGDSLTDSGNVFSQTGIPPAPYFNGRFSNGPTWAELYSERLGTSAVASLNGGTNYAFGSARTGPSEFPFINLVDQVSQYVDNGAPGDASDLFVVWAGSNDVFDAATSGDPTAGIESSLSNIANSISTLHANGAREFLVFNSPPLGQTPQAQASGTLAVFGLDVLSTNFNQGLSSQIADLESGLGIDIQEIDINSFFGDVQANPSSFGLSNVSSAVTPFDTATTLSTGFPTDDPDTFLFWDGIHPTAVGHELIADHVFSLTVSVPEPSGVGVLVTFGSILLLRRKRV